MPTTVTCEHCSEDFSVQFPSEAKKRRFCSHECSNAHHRGPNSPRWQGGNVEDACEECGKIVNRRKDQVAKYENAFCSAKCHGRFMSCYRRGEANPRYNPDKMVTLTCEHCSVKFERERHRAERGQTVHFCTRKCRQANLGGEKHPNWRGGKVEVPCADCGETTLHNPHMAAQGKNRFCDRGCQARYNSRETRGENSPHWRGGPAELTCAVCGDIFLREKSSVPDGPACCSYACMGEFRKRTYRGADHPCWKGGRAGYYGLNWQEQRRQARARDNYTCQACGIAEGNLDRQLSVHHIKPFRDCTSWEDANLLSNLISLCEQCHRQHENDPEFADIARARIAHAAKTVAEDADACAEVPAQPSLIAAE